MTYFLIGIYDMDGRLNRRSPNAGKCCMLEPKSNKKTWTRVTHVMTQKMDHASEYFITNTHILTHDASNN